MWFLKKFIKDNQGGMAISFAVGAMATLTIVSAGLDYGQSQNARRYLQDITDNAVLATAIEDSKNESQKEKYAVLFISELFEMKYNLEILDVDLVQDGDTISLTTSATIKPLFGVVRKRINITVLSETTVNKVGGPVEISFIFDSTASMRFGSRWRDVTTALDDMVDQLEKGAGKDAFRVSLVPFSDRVNLGKMKNRWVDKRFLRGRNASRYYAGCVEPRDENIGGNPNALTNKSQGDIKFVPSTIGTYGPAGFYRGGVPFCPSTPIVYPTHNVNKIKHALDRLRAGGTGRFDVGLAWGYRMLSDTWRKDIGGGKWPDSKKVTKVAVLLTDGYSVAYTREVLPVRHTHPWGWNKATPEGFDNVLNVCDQMKAEGIVIHVIGVNPHVNAKRYLKACASSPEHYHDVRSATDIIDAIGDIGTKTGDLRLSR